jgi:hypothetical protein
VLEIKLKASLMPSKRSTTDLHIQPWKFKKHCTVKCCTVNPVQCFLNLVHIIHKYRFLDSPKILKHQSFLQAPFHRGSIGRN